MLSFLITANSNTICSCSPCCFAGKCRFQSPETARLNKLQAATRVHPLQSWVGVSFSLVVDVSDSYAIFSYCLALALRMSLLWQSSFKYLWRFFADVVRHKRTDAAVGGSRNLVGIFFRCFKENPDFCFMETNQLEVLAHIVLPSEILNYFSVVGIKQTSTEIHIHLDE